MKKNLPLLAVLLAVALVAVVFLPANKKTTKQAIKRGDVLKASIESFEKHRQKLSSSVIESLEMASEELNDENPDLAGVSKDFEKEWTGIQGRYRKLKKDFEDVGQASDAYFTQLDELSNNINNQNLRQEELAKNAELRERWETTYKQAAVNVDKVTQVLESGNDFHMVLVASSIRQKLEQNVDELNRIAIQAKELLKDLEAFTEAGRELVQG
ncbi:MAG: hypothetical protein AAF738_10065 [Bacteroidota bacterium]